MQPFLFCWSFAKRVIPSVPTTMENGDKNRDDFQCMQMSLVKSMRFIFGDD